MILTQVSMSRSGRMLFAGTSTGTVRAMKFPLTVPGEWQEHQAHTGAITKVLKLITICNTCHFNVKPKMVASYQQVTSSRI